MTITIKTFENKAKEFQKKADKSDCYANAQPWIRKVQKLEGTIKAAKNLEKEIKTAQHNLEALTNTATELVEKSAEDVSAVKVLVDNLKNTIKCKNEYLKMEISANGTKSEAASAMKLEMASLKTNLASLNEKLLKAKETLKKVKAEKAEKIAEYKTAVEDAKEALKKFLGEHANELED